MFSVRDIKYFLDTMKKTKEDGAIIKEPAVKVCSSEVENPTPAPQAKSVPELKEALGEKLQDDDGDAKRVPASSQHQEAEFSGSYLMQTEVVKDLTLLLFFSSPAHT